MFQHQAYYYGHDCLSRVQNAFYLESIINLKNEKEYLKAVYRRTQDILTREREWHIGGMPDKRLSILLSHSQNFFFFLFFFCFLFFIVFSFLFLFSFFVFFEREKCAYMSRKGAKGEEESLKQAPRPAQEPDKGFKSGLDLTKHDPEITT